MLSTLTTYDHVGSTYYPDLGSGRWLPVDSLEHIVYSIIGMFVIIACGILLYLLCRTFIPVRPRWGAVVLVLTLVCSTGMPIWVGDPNLLYTFPIYLFFFLLATRGNRLGRLALSIIFFCILMSISALLDTYMGYGFESYDTDLATRLCRVIIIGAIYVGFHRFLPKEPPLLSHNLWTLVLALSLMPLSALFSTVVLTSPRWESDEVLNMTLRLGIGILPFVLATALVLLGAILVLARQTAMEQEHALAAQREIYYEGLRNQDQQLRELRHDLRNHLSAANGLLKLGKVEEARRYLEQLGESKALGRPRRFCENDTANVVLATKAETLEQAGIAYDFKVSLPPELPIANTDLCALLGNALDNAREGSQGLAGATVKLRCRYDKCLFMLSVENPIAAPPDKRLRTTKADKNAHGFGLPSMKNIAARYGGSLETTVTNDHFQLLVCLSV